MNLIVREKGEIVQTRRKKKNKEEKKSIFEIYRSEKTIKDYLFYLKDFLNYIYDGDGEIKLEEVIELMSGIEKDDIESYLSHLIHERNLKKTSLNKIISSLKSLYKELERNGFENPFKHIPLFKTERDYENILKLSFEEIKEILKKYHIKGEKEYRNVTILYTLFYTGMRSQELLGLRFKDILSRDGEEFIKLEKTKSGKEQYKPVHSFLSQKLKSYKIYIEKLYSVDRERIEEQYIFCSSYKKNTPISYPGLYKLIREMGEIIGKEISPHNVRHAIATELSLNGADILEIRDFLGHADTRVTEVYINAKSILEKKVLEKIPLPNID